MAGYVLDTSALLSILRDEDGAYQVVALLENARQQPDKSDQRVLVPFIALMEVEYTLLRHGPADRVDMALRLVEEWPALVVESDVSWRREAARVKAGHSLSVADSWMAALALMHDAELVHKDPEFDTVGGLKAMRLPCKRA